MSIGLAVGRERGRHASGAMLRARAKAATARLWLLPSRPSISPGEKCARSSITCIQSSLSLAGTAAAAAMASAVGLAIVPMGGAMPPGPPSGAAASAAGEPPGSGEP